MATALFVCVENAGRSQMSSALFNRAAGGRHIALSAGTAPAEQVHPVVVEAMQEVGIDLTHAEPTRLSLQLAQAVDVVVTMGCGDACPVVPGKTSIEWELRDPAGLPLEDVRAIRDEIAFLVVSLVEALDEPSLLTQQTQNPA
jgi:protein-tyrosine-phosphatase